MNFRKEKFYRAKFYPIGLTSFDLESFRHCILEVGAKYSDRDSLNLPHVFYNDTNIEIESFDEGDPVCVKGHSSLHVKVAELGYGTIIQNEVSKICSHFGVEFRGTMEILYIKI